MPRAKDKVWAFGEDLHGRFICNFCKKNYSGGASRLKVHLSCLPGRDIAGCTLVSEDVQAQAILMVGGDKSSKKQKHGQSSSPPLEGFEGTPSLHQVTLPAMCEKKDKESVDTKMSFMFVDNNIAFNVVQSASILSFCKGVAEAKLSPEMLEDLVYIRMNSKMKDKVAALEVQDTKAIELEQLGELPEYADQEDVDCENQELANTNIDPTTNNADPDPVSAMFNELFGRE